MRTRNFFAAINPARRLAKSLRFITRTGALKDGLPMHSPVYPEVPAGWPNRATRRAVKQGREHRLDGAWRQALVTQPHLREAIRKF